MTEKAVVIECRARTVKAAKGDAVVALKSIAHKLARAEFHVLRDQKPFDPKRVLYELGRCGH